MAAKLLSKKTPSWYTLSDEDDEASEECSGDENETLEECIKILEDAEPDLHRIQEEEKIIISIIEDITESVPSIIHETIGNVDIESYDVLRDESIYIPPQRQTTDCTSSFYDDREYVSDIPHQEDLTHSYCTYCTKYDRIITVNDIKRGDSIRFEKLLGVYYHHATVIEVEKTNDLASCYLTLIHLQKVGKPLMTKVIKERKKYNFNQTVIEKVIYKNNPFSPDEIVRRAEIYLLQNPQAERYNILGNNCEHITSQIAQDVSVSPQVITRFDQFKSGLSRIMDALCKLGSKFLRIPGISSIGNLYTLNNILDKIRQLKCFLAGKIVCYPCYFREHKELKIALTISLVCLVLSIIGHFNWVSLSISMIVGIAFPFFKPIIIRNIMPRVQPAFLIPKRNMSAQNKPKAGNIVTFDYCNLPHEGIVTEVCGSMTDDTILKATILHFPWPGFLRKYTVTEENIHLKLSDEVFLIDHSGVKTYSPTEVVNLAKKQIGKQNHNGFTYRSSHLARYCKTGDKKLEKLPKRQVKSADDVSPGDVIEFKYCGFSHEALVIKIDYAQSVEAKVIHYNYNGVLGSREVVEENIVFSLSNGNNYIHEYNSMDTYEANEVVRRARSRVGEKKFNVFTNRSSHLAKWCKLK